EPLRFFNGGRKVSSVLKDASLSRRFRELHGDRYRVVRDYFQPRQGVVSIEDVAGLLPHIFLKTLDIADPDGESEEGVSGASVTKPSVSALPLVALFRRFHGTEHLTNPK